jgi:hypothetical protein
MLVERREVKIADVLLQEIECASGKAKGFGR